MNDPNDRGGYACGLMVAAFSGVLFVVLLLLMWWIAQHGRPLQ